MNTSPDIKTNAVPPSAKDAAERNPFDSQKPAVSRGEKIFDSITYGAINWTGTFVASVVAGYLAKYGAGKEFYEKCVDKMSGKWLGRESADNVLMTTMLMMGGNLMLIPVGIMETFKKPIVHWLNKRFSSEGVADSASEALSQQPKQSWWNLIKGRIAAWTIVFSAFQGASKLLGKERFENIQNASGTLACAIMGKPEFRAGEASRTYNVGKISFLDAIATTASAILLYVTSKFFARQDQQNKEEAHTPLLAPKHIALHHEKSDPSPSSKSFAAGLSAPADYKQHAQRKAAADTPAL